MKVPIGKFKLSCVICRKTFISNRSAKKTCSPECHREKERRRWIERYSNKAKKTRECLVCKKEFVYRENRQMLCSPECAREYKATKKLKEKKCVVCLTIFTPTHVNVKTCSPECKEINTIKVQKRADAKKARLKQSTPKSHVTVEFQATPPDIVCEFRHLRPGDPGFDELAAQVTPLDKIKSVATPCITGNPGGVFHRY